MSGEKAQELFGVAPICLERLRRQPPDLAQLGEPGLDQTPHLGVGNDQNLVHCADPLSPRLPE